MIVILCLLVIFICGLIMTINPKIGINPNKLKEGITYEEAVKKNKKAGIIALVAGAIFLLIFLF